MRTSHSRHGAQKVQDKNDEEITIIITITTPTISFGTRRHNNYTKQGVIISPGLQMRKLRLKEVEALV